MSLIEIFYKSTFFFSIHHPELGKLEQQLLGSDGK